MSKKFFSFSFRHLMFWGMNTSSKSGWESKAPFSAQYTNSNVNCACPSQIMPAVLQSTSSGLHVAGCGSNWWYHPQNEASTSCSSKRKETKSCPSPISFLSLTSLWRGESPNRLYDHPRARNIPGKRPKGTSSGCAMVYEWSFDMVLVQ